MQERDVTTRLEVATPFASNFIATHAPVSDSCVWIAFACVPVRVCVDCVTAHRCFSTYVENTFATRVVLPRSLTTVNLHRANPLAAGRCGCVRSSIRPVGLTRSMHTRLYRQFCDTNGDKIFPARTIVSTSYLRII